MKTLSYGRQWINDDDITAIVNVLRGDWLTMGPTVKAFEESLATYAGVRHAVTFSSGTSALHGALRPMKKQHYPTFTNPADIAICL